MSIRIHVVAVRSHSEVNLEHALLSLISPERDNKCLPFRFGFTGDWQWATASARNVSGGEIDRILATLPVAALRVTSSDGTLWTLTLAAAGRQIFRGVHHFTSVGCYDEDCVTDERVENEADPDFPVFEPEEVAGIDRDDPELQFLWDEAEAQAIKLELMADATINVPWRADYLEYGVVFPSEVVGQLEGLPSLTALRVASHIHAKQIADELAEHRVPFDRNAMLQLLTAGPLTKWERESDLGNLFRFLSLLGIRGINDEALVADPEATEVPTKTGVDWSQYRGTEHLDSVRALTGGRELQPIVGGPIDLRFTGIVQLLAIARFCDEDDDDVLISLRLPADDYILDKTWTRIASGVFEFEREGDRCSFGFSDVYGNLEMEDSNELDNHALVQALQTLPSGYEVDFAHATTATRDACHRFSGVIIDGGFQLISAYPPLTIDNVRDVLTLMQLTLGRKAIPVDSPDEERRMREAYHYVSGETARIRHGKIKADAGTRHAIVGCKFATQFSDRGAWDVGDRARQRRQVAAELDELLQQRHEAWDSEQTPGPEGAAKTAKWAAQFEDLASRMQLAKMVPRTNDLICDGKVSRYFHAPILRLNHVTAEEIAQEDRQFGDLGFAWVCDSASEKFGETISRGYAGVNNAIALYERRTAANSHCMNDEGYILDLSHGIHEFQTHFNDGATLVTNDVNGTKSVPKKRIFVRSYEGSSISELWARHLDGVKRLQEKRGTTALDHTQFNNPAAFCRIVDELMHRLLK